MKLMNTSKPVPAVLLTAVLSLLALPTARAATWYVAATGNDVDPGTQAQPFRTIGQGIAAAASADTVLVGAGTFAENITWTGKSLTLRGAGPGQSIVDGGGAGACLTLTSVPALARLDGFTIQNGRSSNPSGGMVNFRSNLIVSNCTFTGNTGNAGGGMYNSEGSPVVTDCTFSNNIASGGGGMFNYGASPRVTKCIFTGNSANFDGGGGMSNKQSSSPTVTDCTFTGNTSSSGDTSVGGGGGMKNTAGSRPTVTRCTFTNNSTSGNDIGGGGIYNFSGFAFDSGSTCADCTFTGNSVLGLNASGGGIDNYYSASTINRCTFSNNRATLGGGISCDSGRQAVINCTFIGNIANSNLTSQGRGAGMHLNDTAFSDTTVTHCTFSGNSGIGTISSLTANTNTKIANCILWANPAGGIINVTGTPTVTYSDVQGGYTGTGNLNADPLFASAAAGNYRLDAGSPCINAGSAAVPGLPATDLDGALRLQGSAPDLGAYEFGSWFVDKTAGSDINRGDALAPFATVTRAITAAVHGDSIYVKRGNYGSDRPRITKTLRLFNWGDAGLARLGQP